MSLSLKPGMRLFGAACATEGIVVRATDELVDLRIGGLPALTDATGRGDAITAPDGHAGPALMGKRYVDETGSLELLCTKPGDGAFAIGDAVCGIKDAKALPSSD